MSSAVVTTPPPQEFKGSSARGDTPSLPPQLRVCGGVPVAVAACGHPLCLQCVMPQTTPTTPTTSPQQPPPSSSETGTGTSTTTTTTTRTRCCVCGGSTTWELNGNLPPPLAPPSHPQSAAVDGAAAVPGSNQLLRTTNLTIHQQASAPEAERDVVEALIETHPMKAGEVWFLISCTWFNHWKRYVRYQQRPSYSEFEGKPGPIDNAVLIEQNGDLNRFATERTDYELINGIVWKTLKGWYSGGPDIPRAVISTPGPYEDDSLSVEVRPLTLGIVKSSDDEDKMVAQFSKMDTVGNLKKTMCERMGLEPDNVHVWDYFGGAWQRHLCDEEQTLASAQIMTNQLVMLDEKSDAGSWPSHKQGYQYSRI